MFVWFEPLKKIALFFLPVFGFFFPEVLAYIYFTRIVLVLFSAMLPFEVRGRPPAKATPTVRVERAGSALCLCARQLVRTSTTPAWL